MRLDWDEDYDLDRNCAIWVLTARDGAKIITIVFDHQPSRAEMVEAEETARERLR